MPIYEYRCEECGALTERLEGVGGATGTPVCSACGSDRVRKVLSAPSPLPAESRMRSGQTCCGREERCSTPPCSTGQGCRRHLN